MNQSDPVTHHPQDHHGAPYRNDDRVKTTLVKVVKEKNTNKKTTVAVSPTSTTLAAPTLRGKKRSREKDDIIVVFLEIMLTEHIIDELGEKPAINTNGESTFAIIGKDGLAEPHEDSTIKILE